METFETVEQAKTALQFAVTDSLEPFEHGYEISFIDTDGCESTTWQVGFNKAQVVRDYKKAVCFWSSLINVTQLA